MNYQEYKQSINKKLSDKVQCELLAFREEMLGRPPQDIYKDAYQIILKNDIAELFSETDYSPREAKALLKSSNLLQEIYDEWLETDYTHMDDLQQTVAAFKDYMIKTEKILSHKKKFY